VPSGHGLALGTAICTLASLAREPMHHGPEPPAEVGGMTRRMLQRNDPCILHEILCGVRICDEASRQGTHERALFLEGLRELEIHDGLPAY
jgi:hypothetical protein